MSAPGSGTFSSGHYPAGSHGIIYLRIRGKRETRVFEEQCTSAQPLCECGLTGVAERGGGIRIAKGAEPALADFLSAYVKEVARRARPYTRKNSRLARSCLCGPTGDSSGGIRPSARAVCSRAGRHVRHICSCTWRAGCAPEEGQRGGTARECSRRDRWGQKRAVGGARRSCAPGLAGLGGAIRGGRSGR
jgi:hypothetical protein